MAAERWTVIRLLTWTEEFLRGKGIETPRLEAQILLAHALKCDRIHLYTRTEEEPAEAEKAAFRELVKKRAEGCPTAYLVGYREFYSLRFEVSPAVLIPRPETELLVLTGLDAIAKLAAPRVLDIGTGSGCIAITIAKRNSTATVVAVDRSEAALEIARKNAARHGVTDRVRFLAGDLCGALPAGESFDLVLSNPPYISGDEFDALDRTVRDFEPKEALWGGADGLEIYRRLIPGVIPHLKPGGDLAVEIGFRQREAVESLFAESLESVRTIFDDAKLARIVLGTRR